MPVAPSTDWFLQNLVGTINRSDIEVGLTLNVGGSLVTGTAISGKKYFNEFAAIYSGAFPLDQETKDKVRVSIEQFANIYIEEAEKPPALPPNFIHMRNVHTIHGVNFLPTEQGVLWRGRVSSVDGFSLGSMAPGSAQ